MGMPNKIVGMIHGVLFILYIVFLCIIARQYKLPGKTIAYGLFASIAPILPFYFHRTLEKEVKMVDKQNL
jgi:integral membrane protein